MSDAQRREQAQVLGQLLRDEVDEAVLGASRIDTGVPGDQQPAWLRDGQEKLIVALQTRSRPSARVSPFVRKDAGSFPRHVGTRHVGTRHVGEGSSRLRLGLLVALGALATLAGVLSARWFERTGAESSPALTFSVQYSVGEQEPRQTGRVVAREGGEVLRFSDGSRLKLTSGSAVRVRETDARGAMVILEEGKVDSQVTHRSDSRWSLFAGPYEVRVVGTRFSTTWEPSTQQVSVVLQEGTVQVLGRGIEETVELKPGQRFDGGSLADGWAVRSVRATREAIAAGQPAEEMLAEGKLPTGTAAQFSPAMQVDGKASPAQDAPSTESARQEGTRTDASRAGLPEGPRPASVAGTATRSEGERSPQRSAPAEPTWSQLVRAGQFEQVVREADARGMDRCLSTCSAAELSALADAARYTGRLSAAEGALLRLRELSPAGGPRAGYLLGSVLESRGQMAAALEWYGRYLVEAPGGSFAAEARAGRMRTLSSLGRVKAARSAASEYLRLYPQGAGAGTARRILDRP